MQQGTRSRTELSGFWNKNKLCSIKWLSSPWPNCCLNGHRSLERDDLGSRTQPGYVTPRAPAPFERDHHRHLPSLWSPPQHHPVLVQTSHSMEIPGDTTFTASSSATQTFPAQLARSPNQWPLHKHTLYVSHTGQGWWSGLARPSDTPLPGSSPLWALHAITSTK